MIESISILNYLGESVEVELRSPEKSGFFIKNIDGLGPPKATINTNAIAGADGVTFNSARTEKRNVVFQMGFHGIPGERTIEDARHLSYKFFPIKSKVTITIKTTNRTLYTTGYVESNEPDIFSKQQLTTISVLCPDPYFNDADNNYRVYTLGVPVALFEFPFEDVLSESPSLEFSSDTVGGSKEFDVFNPGNTTVGITLEIWSGVTLGGVYFDRMVNNVWQRMYFESIENFISGGIQSGDTLHLSTVKGDKYAYVVREGVEYNVLSALVDYEDLVWMELDPGDNHLRFGASLGFDDVELYLRFKPEFEGV